MMADCRSCGAELAVDYEGAFGHPTCSCSECGARFSVEHDGDDHGDHSAPSDMLPPEPYDVVAIDNGDGFVSLWTVQATSLHHAIHIARQDPRARGCTLAIERYDVAIARRRASQLYHSPPPSGEVHHYSEHEADFDWPLSRGVRDSLGRSYGL